MPRERFSSETDFDPQEVTNHGFGAQRVQELHDMDALVMLGKLASATARLEKRVEEFAAAQKEDRAAWREERKELLSLARAQKRSTRTSTGLVAALVVLIQAVSAALHSSGIIK